MKLKIYFTILAVVLCTIVANSQNVLSTKLFTTDKVCHVAKVDAKMNRAYIGGEFSYANTNPTAACFFKIDSLAFQNPKGFVVGTSVEKMVDDGKGGFFVGGYFENVRDQKVWNLAWFDSTGNAKKWTPKLDQIVYNMTRADSLLIITGRFDTVNGIGGYKGLAIYDINNDSFYSSPTAASYIGGAYHHFGFYDNYVLLGYSGTSIYKFNPFKLIVTSIPIDRKGSDIYGHKMIKGILYLACKTGTSIGTDPITSFIRIDTSIFKGYMPSRSFYGIPSGIEFANDRIFIYGSNLKKYRQNKGKGLLCLNWYGQKEVNLNTDFPESISSMKFHRDKLWISSKTRKHNSKTVPAVYAVDTSTFKYSMAGPPFGVAPSNLNTVNNTIYFSHRGFPGSSLYWQPKGSFAVQDLVSNKLLESPSTNGTVYDVDYNDSLVALVGSFTKVGLQNTQSIALLSRDSLKMLKSTYKVNGPIIRCHFNDNFLYLAGQFSAINGTGCSNMARIDVKTLKVDNNWKPYISYQYSAHIAIRVLTDFKDFIAVGGYLESGSEKGLIFFSKKNGNSAGFNVQANGTSSTLVNHNTIFIGGGFTSIQSKGRLGKGALVYSNGKLKVNGWLASNSSMITTRGLVNLNNTILLGSYSTSGNQEMKLYNKQNGKLRNFTPFRYGKSYLSRIDYEDGHMFQITRSAERNLYLGHHFTLNVPPTVQTLQHNTNLCLNSFSDTSEIELSDINGDSVQYWHSTSNGGIIPKKDFLFTRIGNKLLITAKSGSQSGKVDLKIFTSDGIDTSETRISYIVNNPKQLTVNGDTSYCFGDTLALEISPSFKEYHWSNDSLQKRTQFWISGPHWAYGIDQHHCQSDTVYFTLTEWTLPKATLDSTGGTSACADDTIHILTRHSHHNVWENGDTSNMYITSDTMKSSVNLMVTDKISGCRNHIIVPLKWVSRPIANISKNATDSFCVGTSVQFVSGQRTNEQAIWEPIGHTGSSYNHFVMVDQWVHVAVSNKHCASQDSIQVFAKPIPTLSLKFDSTLCRGDSFLFSINTNGSVIITPNVDTQTYIILDTTTRYTIKSKLNDCIVEDTVNVVVNDLPSAGALEFDDRYNRLSSNSGYQEYDWYRNGNLVLTSDSNTFWIDSDGIYQLRVTDGNGCKSFTDTLSVLIVGTEHSLSQIFIFPNPTSNQFTLLGLEIHEVEQVKLISMNGQILYPNQLAKHIYSVHETPPGAYIIEVTLGTGFKTYEKLIIE